MKASATVQSLDDVYVFYWVAKYTLGLALESRAPGVPCAMINTFEFLPPGSMRPQLRIRTG